MPIYFCGYMPTLGNLQGLLFTIRAKKGQFMELQGRRKTCSNHQRQLPTGFILRSLRRSNNKLRDNGVKGDEDTFIGRRQGALTGSIFSEAPTILVEMVFLTNPKDAEWIKQDRNKQTMARALAAGVRAVRDSH